MKKVVVSFILLFSVACATLSLAKEPTNIEIARQNVIRYHDSGAYEKDINKIIVQALNYLDWRLAQHTFKGKPAIVLDIDETSLSNYTNLLQYKFAGSPTDIKPFQFNSNDPALAPTLRLFQYAVKNQLPVFFISGRFEKDRGVTETALKSAGFTPWQAVLLRTEPEATLPNAAYKASLRKQLTEQGYDIILSLGDQQTDFVGGYADKTFKLPNPYYLVT